MKTALTYEWTSPSGVRVRSCEPKPAESWWDDPRYHIVWSYASWTSLILKAYGRPWMRKALARRGWWSA